MRATRSIAVAAVTLLLAAPTAAATTPYRAFKELLHTSAALATADRQAALDRFIDTQRDGLGGFPLRESDRVLFVHRGAGGPYAVAGSWNGWSRTAQPLVRVGATDVWTLETRLPGADRYEYKVVDNGAGLWLSDALNRKFTYGNDNSVVNLAGSGQSHLERHAAVSSPRLANDRDVIVYLPPGALDGGGPFPTVYMHDGQNLFDGRAMWGGWEVDAAADRLIGSDAIRPVIVVGIANTADRVREYTHVADDISDRCDGSVVLGGGADAYADFCALELKPRMDALYPTAPDRQDTAVLGSSLGGLVSLYIGYRHSHVFGNVGGMSPTLGWGGYCLGGDRLIDLARREGRIDTRFYLDAGGVGAQRPAADNWRVTEELKQLYESQGYAHGRDLAHWWEPGAAHNEAAWRDRVEKPLRFWFPR
jgi:predicted alpha/beta superfamily hydrolase